MDKLAFYLSLVALMLGWWLGFRHSLAKNNSNKLKDGGEKSRDAGLSACYLGLNYLLNDNPDKALDVFTKLLEVNADTVEIHLILGALFRNRGEVERAIHVHQNLIARSQLWQDQRKQILLELANDYLVAGLYDRAEQLFLQLQDNNYDDEITKSSLHGLVTIYQKQKDWQQALNIAKKIDKKEGAKIIAYCYCELAEEAKRNNMCEQAKKYLAAALKHDKNSVQASIGFGKIYYNEENYEQAVKYFRLAEKQDSDYLAEIIDFLVISYQKIGQELYLINELEELMMAKQASHYCALKLVDHFEQAKGIHIAADYLMQQLGRNFSLPGLAKLIDLYSKMGNSHNNSQLMRLRDFVNAVVKKYKKRYKCLQCGLLLKNLYWQCPKCQSLSSIKPVC